MSKKTEASCGFFLLNKKRSTFAYSYLLVAWTWVTDTNMSINMEMIDRTTYLAIIAFLDDGWTSLIFKELVKNFRKSERVGELLCVATRICR